MVVILNGKDKFEVYEDVTCVAFDKETKKVKLEIRKWKTDCSDITEEKREVDGIDNIDCTGVAGEFYGTSKEGI